jgi:hypothetical protein
MYRVRTNYWTILLDHIFSWKCAMILKFMSDTTQWMHIWNNLNAVKAISQEKHTSLFDKMAALPTERSWCVLEFVRSNSVVAVQRVFCWQFGRRGSPALSIQRWYEQFRHRGCICQQGKGRTGRQALPKRSLRECMKVSFGALGNLCLEPVESCRYRSPRWGKF